MNEQPPTTRTAFSGALLVARRMLEPMLRPQVATTLVVVVWLVAIFTVAAISLPLPQVGFAQDVGVMLDAGWRYYQGLRTHADYHSPLGPLFAIIFGLPMKIAGPTYASYKLLPPVVTGIFTAWTIAVCTGSSLHPIVRASLAAGVAAAAGGLFHLGFPVEALSFAVFYNRIGFALLCIIGLAALLPRDALKMPRWVAPARDASIAAASVMLLFLKVNFFFAALPFWLASAFLHRRTRGHVLAFGAALVGTSLFFLNEIGFRLDRMLGDLHMAADARRACLDSFFFPLRNAASNHDFGILLALSTLAYGTALRGSTLPYRILAALTAMLWAPALLGFALTLMQSHGDGRGIPLVLVGMASCLAWAAALSTADHAPLIGGSEVRLRNTSLLRQARILGGACLVCAAALFVVPHAYSYAYLLDVSRNAGPRQFIGAGIRDLYIGAYGNNLEPGAVIKMNDASQLLARHARPGDSLQYMDMNNIYTFANHLRSPRKSMLFWDNRSSYTAASHPPVSDFSDTDLLMAPKQQLTAAPLETEWWSIYAYAIEDEYDLVEETNFFRLWRRTAKP